MRTPIAHALADIQHQLADQVRLVVVLLHVELVGAAEHFPVDVSQVVARRVLAVLGKLDREAVKGAAVQARHIAFHDVPSTQMQAFDLSQRPRI